MTVFASVDSLLADACDLKIIYTALLRLRARTGQECWAEAASCVLESHDTINKAVFGQKWVTRVMTPSRPLRPYDSMGIG